MTRARAIVLLSCVLPLAVGAQQRPVRDAAAQATTGTATLSGIIVTDTPAARPVRRALVSLTSTDGLAGARQTLTDDTGAFTFVELPAGRYALSASKPGMVTTAYGAKRPERPGSAIQVAEGQHVSSVRLRMLPGAVIAGTVRDASVQPVAGARVHVMRYRFGYQTGERELASVAGGLGEATDDRGHYRIYGLPPGEYVVVVTASQFGPRGGTAVHQTTAADVQWAMRQMTAAGRSPATAAAPPPAGPDVDYAPIFHPGTADQANASVVALDAGQERTDVDVTLLFVPTATLECTVASAAGPAPPSLQVTLIAHNRLGGIPFSGFSSAPTQRDGKYVFRGLVPGEYSVMARVRPTPAGGPRGAAPPEASAAQPDVFAIERVRVAGSDTSVSLTLRPGATVSGRLAFDGSAAPPSDLTKARVSLAPVLTGGAVVLGVPAATVDADGRFTFRGVTPARYRINASLPGAGRDPWQATRADVSGEDALDVPFEVGAGDVGGIVVTFTDRPAELSGTIQDAQGHPAPEFFIIVFARDRAHWLPQSRRIRSARPDSAGRFVFANLPPGQYGLAAVTDVEPNEWFDPAFLRQLEPASIPIALGEGEKKVQDIRTQSPRPGP
jgi:protocatechuate 3,4-dioxygenase beta subunit